MFTKLREKIYIQRKVRKPLTDLFADLKNIRSKTDLLVICPQTTGNSWVGIQVASKALFENVFIIPQYFSSSVYTQQELETLAKEIDRLGFSQVIFSGFCSYFSHIILALKKENRIIVSVIFHGALSEFAHNQRPVFDLIDLFKNKYVHKIGFVKKGLSTYFNRLLGGEACFSVLLKTNNTECAPLSFDAVSIGVFGVHNFNKNTYNQVSAGLLISDAKIHVLDKNSFAFLHADERIQVHPRMDHERFRNLLGSMTINSHISFSESWGQIVSESLALGVPCITSDNNGILDYSTYLQQKLIVQQYDNPEKIADRMADVIENRNEIAEEGKKYIQELNRLAEQKLDLFIRS